MNARTLLPLAIVTAVLSVSMTASAAENPAPPGAALSDNKAQAKARAALYADELAPTESAPKAATAPSATKKEQLVKEPAAAPAAVVTLAGPQPDTEAQARARAALYTSEPAAVSLEGVQPDTEAQAKARMALSAVEPAPAAAVATPQEATTGTNPLAAGMAAPALPTDAAQQQQLNALLQQYRSDQISASQYHTQRAEILAGR